MRVTRQPQFAVLLLALALTGCAAKSTPHVVAVTGDRLAQTIGELQRGVTVLQQASIITAAQALPAQEALLRANGAVAQLPPLLRAIEATPEDATQVDQAVALLVQVSDALRAVGVGWPQQDAVVKVIEAVKAAQQVVITTAVAIGRAQGDTP